MSPPIKNNKIIKIIIGSLIALSMIQSAVGFGAEICDGAAGSFSGTRFVSGVSSTCTSYSTITIGDNSVVENGANLNLYAAKCLL